MKNFNWGHGIAAVIVFFMGLMGFLVISAINEESHLVSVDYYKQEIEYQSIIDKRVNLKERGEKVLLKVEDGLLILQFPYSKGELLKGKLLFLRPSDPKLDLNKEIEVDDKGVMSLALDQFVKGLYQVKLDWVSKEEYYQEQEFYIP